MHFNMPGLFIYAAAKLCGNKFNIIKVFLKFSNFFTQLLLCVGEFFGTTAEAEAEWQQYKSGAKKGMSVSINTLRTVFFNLGVARNAQYSN